MATQALPKDVKVYRLSMPGHDCPWGLRAIQLLSEQHIPFEDIKLPSQEAVDAFKTLYQVTTTPQIFFGAERVGGYTDLAKRLQVPVEAASISYVPVIAVFSTAGLMALATSLGLTGLMGFSLSMLASLKLMDISSFAASFAKYDLIAQRTKLYGKVYPFTELLIGLGFLSGIAPLATGVASLTLGLIGVTSVTKAVFIDKLALNCACVGGNFKAPLGVVSFAENMIMAGMGAMLAFSALAGAVMPSRQPAALRPTVVPPAAVAENFTPVSSAPVRLDLVQA